MNYLTVLFGFQMYGYILAGFELLFLNSLLTAYFQILGFFFSRLPLWSTVYVANFFKKSIICVFERMSICETQNNTHFGVSIFSVLMGTLKA